MTRKIVNNSDAGSSTVFGGDDLDKVNGYLTGVDQTSTDPVTINTTTTFKDGKIALRNPADTKSAIIKAGAQVTTDKTFTLPVTADDTIATVAAIQTFTNKTLTAPLQSSYEDFARISAPSNPSTNQSRIYCKQIDSNNDGVFALIKKGGSFVEVQIL